MKGSNLLFAVFSVSVFQATGQQIDWQNTIGGSDYDRLFSLQQTTDGGFILGGLSRSGMGGDKSKPSNGWEDYWLVKTDALGVVQWDRTIGGNDGDELNSVRQTTDGGFILGGFSHSGASGDKSANNWGQSDYWLVKTDSAGQVQWDRTIGGSLTDELHAVRQTTDGGYVLAGDSYSGATGDKTENSNGASDYWIIKLDSAGNILWQNTIGGSDDEFLYDVRQTPDGGYILAGWSQSDISGDKTENSQGGPDYWIVKTDAAGNIQWQNTIGGSDDDRLYSIDLAHDGGYVLGGASKSDSTGDKTTAGNGDFDYWMIKTNANGVIDWQFADGTPDPERAYAVRQAQDKGYVTGGYNGADYRVIKTDSAGLYQWQGTYGGSKDDALFSLEPAAGGGYILGGVSYSDISGNKTENCQGIADYWILLINDTTFTVSVPAVSPEEMLIYMYPVPASEILHVSAGRLPGPARISVFDIQGRVRYFLESGAAEWHIQTGKWPAGLYFLELQSAEVVVRKKFIIR